MCYSGYLRKCEWFDLCKRTWKNLHTMRETRCRFNPCKFNDFVYLCGGGSQLIEAFSPQTNRFIPLQLQLPQISDCTVYTHNSLLVVHSRRYISKYSAGQEGQLLQHSQTQSKTTVNKRSNSQPVLEPISGLFFICQKDTCVCFCMETGEEVQNFD